MFLNVQAVVDEHGVKIPSLPSFVWSGDDPICDIRALSCLHQWKEGEGLTLS